MKISIIKVADFKKETERVLLKVTGTCNLQEYMVADTTYRDPEHVSNELRHIYWFPDQKVQDGDQVTLYTREGKNTMALDRGTGRRHFTYYWNLHETIWNNTGDAAILFELSNAELTPVK